jgi:hypothetical protein
MPQKHFFLVLWAALGNQKSLHILTFQDWVLFHKLLTKFLIISSTLRSSETHQIYNRNVEKSCMYVCAKFKTLYIKLLRQCN